MILLVPAITFLGLGVLLLLARPDLPPLPGFNHHKPPHHAPPPPPPPHGDGHDAPAPKVWEPPKVDPLIHGMHASDYAKTEHPYELQPFPPSPLGSLPPAGATDKDAPVPWLAAVICTPWDVERRMLIRTSWMRLYKDLPFDARFVVSNPGPEWVESIRLENSTFGDMIVLDNLREDDFTANTVKTLGFYRWLVDKSPRRYEFVSKMDTDLWLNARGFWDRYLEPRLSAPDDDEGAPLRATVEKTIIGQLYYSPPHKIVFPHGSMYTVTWDMVSLLADLQDEHHVVAGEDMAMAVLMLKGHQQATVINMRGSEKFDFDERDTRHDGSAWAVDTTRPTAAEHALYGPDVIAVHQLKSNEAWLKVAACFDENGIKPMPSWKAPPPAPEPKEPTPPEELPADANDDARKKHDDAQKEYDAAKKEFEEAKKQVMRYSRSRFDAIPGDYWEHIGGTWLCNGIWKTPEGVDRNPELPE
jgi:hypothetical protein